MCRRAPWGLTNSMENASDTIMTNRLLSNLNQMQEEIVQFLKDRQRRLDTRVSNQTAFMC